MSALEPGNNEGKNCAINEAPALIGDVNASLRKASCVAHHIEKEVGVIGKQRVAAHLSEEAHHGRNEETTSHTGGSDHVEPGLPRMLEFELNSRFDLGHFCLDDGR